MAIYKDFKTIPQLFQIITKDFAKGKDRAVFKHKVDDHGKRSVMMNFTGIQKTLH